MYLTERIIGVTTYMLTMIIFCYYIAYNLKDKRKLKNILLIYNLVLSVFAFFYIPAPSADLYRHYITFDNLLDYSFNNIWNYSLKTTVPVFYIYVFLISRLKMRGFLPAITSFIFHGCVFTILTKATKKFDIDNKSIALSLILFMEMGKFLEVISGIRCLMAFSIICLCIYNELVEGTKIYRNILLYLFACFMHTAAIALTIIRLLYLFLQNEKNILFKFLNIIFLLIIIVYFSTNSNYFIEAMISKTEYYVTGSVYSYVWEYIISWISILFSLYTIFKFKTIIKENLILKNYCKFLVLLNIIIIIFCFEYSIFTRFQTTSSILFIPLFGYILSELKKRKIYSKNYKLILTLTLIIIFVLAGVRGNLCGYKFLKI